MKAARFTLHGQQVQSARVACPSTGEVGPLRWWEAARDALSRLGPDPIAAVGVCGRGGTAVLLDASGASVAPSWDDDRAAADLRALRGAAPPGATAQSLALLAKARWWERERGPVETAFSAKDFVVYLLTGERRSDPAGGGWVGGGAPHPLQPACEPWALAGWTRPDVSPLREGIPVAVGWHDGAAATLGAGAAFEGTAPVTLGTTAVYRVVARSLPPGLRRYWDLTPGLTVTGGDILHAGLAWDRATAWLAAGADPRAAAPGCGGVAFLPQLSGRIAPDVDRTARGAWTGLSAATTPADLARSVLEGVAFSLRQVRDWLRRHDLRASVTVATGGGARSRFQVQVLADVLGEIVEVCPFEEGCRGAALLGGVAAGLLSLDEARAADPGRTAVAPADDSADLYGGPYARFLAAQRAAGGGSDA